MATFEYHGPPCLVVALQREVQDGETVEGPDALRHSYGFTEVKKGKAGAPKDQGGDE